MKSISFSFDNFDLIINPFEFTGMNFIVTVIQDSVAVFCKHICKFIHDGIVERSRQEAPFINGFSGPRP
jgi:hypothetical protein